MTGVNLVGKSAKILSCIETAGKFARTDHNILISGETGTGKELLAHFVHKESRRAKGPFIVIPCTLANPDYIFGSGRRKGKIAAAEGGTLLFDEITDLSPDMQRRLLKFFDRKKYSPVSSDRELTADLRIIVTTCHDLVEQSRIGRFRNDLYFRIAVCVIKIPPLREHPEDIPDIVNYFLKSDIKKDITIPPELIAKLMNYDWPGNIRELRNTLIDAIVTAKDGNISLYNFPASNAIKTPPERVLLNAPFSELIKEYRKRVLRAALDQTNGNQTKAAKLLHIDRVHFVKLIKSYGLRENR